MGHIQDLLAIIRGKPDHVFVRALDELLPRWIPVSERLPGEGEPVLACWVPRKDGMACAMVRNLNGKVCWTPADQWTECDPPKCWMPLPEPPEVK